MAVFLSGPGPHGHQEFHSCLGEWEVQDRVGGQGPLLGPFLLGKTPAILKLGSAHRGHTAQKKPSAPWLLALLDPSLLCGADS